MGRVGEGFNLARVNQASLIDEPALALRAERVLRGHGPCRRGQWGTRDGRNRRAGIVRVQGYKGTSVSAAATWSRGCWPTPAAMYLPARAALQIPRPGSLTNKLRSTEYNSEEPGNKL